MISINATQRISTSKPLDEAPIKRLSTLSLEIAKKIHRFAPAIIALLAIMSLPTADTPLVSPISLEDFGSPIVVMCVPFFGPGELICLS